MSVTGQQAVNRPVVTISDAEQPVGTILTGELNVRSFFVNLTWDRNVSGFSGADISVTSSNSNMSVSRSLPENIGTAGTTSQYRTELTITGDGITTVTLTVRSGAVPATGAQQASEERTRSYSINTFPSPMVMIGEAESAPGTGITGDITVRNFSVLFTWDRNIGTGFDRADVNVVSNNPRVQPSVARLDLVSAGISYRAHFQLSGAGAAVVTAFVNQGAIPTTSNTSQSSAARRTFNVDLGSGSTPTGVGTMSGPSATQSGGAVLLKSGGSGSIEPPDLSITATNIDEARQPSVTPVLLNISFVWNEPVTGFSQGTPNYVFVPRESEHGDPTKEPQIVTWSGVNGNATYQQTIEIQGDSAGEIEIFVNPETAESVENEEVYGPPPPGTRLEVFYDTTIAGNPAPTVNISIPPTTYFVGTTYTTTFLWSQPIEQNTFTANQVIIDGATPGELIQDTESRNRFTMELTLPETGEGEVVITVLDYRIISTAAKGIVSRREGPEGTQSEVFKYDQSYTTPTSTTTGATTLCEITQPIRTNPYLDNVLTPNPFGGAFAGTSDLTYISYRGKNYLYGVVQIIKRRLGTSSDLNNQDEAGAALFEVNLTDSTCRIIKQYAFITIAARSLTVHQNRLWWFEGSHYGDHEKYAPRYPSHLGDLFSLEPGTTTLVNEGVTRRTQFEAPSLEETNYGYHTQMASPMISDGDNLYMISGFGGQESITSTNYATSKRTPREAEAETDIRNWSLINYSKNLEQRIELFNANGETGWSALSNLARITNSFIGFDRYGSFYFKPKGGTMARVQSSAPSTLEFKEENQRFPQYGLIAVSGELIEYSGLIGRQFLNLERAQHGTTQVSPCQDSFIHLIDHVIDTSKPVFDPIENANIRDTADQIYNKIVVNYADTVFEYQDNLSINIFGERIYELDLPLTQYQADWVEVIARRFINAHKNMHYLIKVNMDFDLSMEITQVVFLQVKDRANLNQPCQIYEVNHDANRRKTELTLRTL